MVDETNLEQNIHDETKDGKNCLKILDIWEDENCLNALQNGQLPNSVFEEEMCKVKKRVYEWNADQFFSKKLLVPKPKDLKGIIISWNYIKKLGTLEKIGLLQNFAKDFTGTIALSKCT
jgi:hypothetical protein